MTKVDRVLVRLGSLLGSISDELFAAQFPMRKGVCLLGASLFSSCGNNWRSAARRSRRLKTRIIEDLCSNVSERWAPSTFGTICRNLPSSACLPEWQCAFPLYPVQSRFSWLPVNASSSFDQLHNMQSHRRNRRWACSDRIELDRVGGELGSLR